jgi:hypothetical protein
LGNALAPYTLRAMWDHCRNNQTWNTSKLAQRL